MSEAPVVRSASPPLDAGEPAPVLTVANLTIRYGGIIMAVDGVDLTIRAGEVVGVIGESGSGKSTLAHAILGLLPRGTTVAGDGFRLGDTDMLAAGPTEKAALRGPVAAMIFQNPMTAFSPVHTLGQQLTDLLWRNARATKAEKRARIAAMLTETGIPDAAAKLDLYPFQFSGGMLQRVAIAAAFLMEPALLIADEPTTALDVTMEAQILALMRQMRERSGVSILMISHHLGVIAEICDRVAVMYAGRIVEEGPVGAIFADPRHPYTRALIACELALIPPGIDRLPVIPGEVPRALGQGCGFAGRCAKSDALCHATMPGWSAGSEPMHRYRCHRSAP